MKITPKGTAGGGSPATPPVVATSNGLGEVTNANFSGKTIGSNLFIKFYQNKSNGNTELGEGIASLVGSTVSGLAPNTKYKFEIY